MEVFGLAGNSNYDKILNCEIELAYKKLVGIHSDQPFYVNFL